MITLSNRQSWRIQMQWELPSCAPVRDYSKSFDLAYAVDRAALDLSSDIELARWEFRHAL